MFVCMHASVCMRACLNKRVSAYVCLRERERVGVFMFVNVYLCLCVCVAGCVRACVCTYACVRESKRLQSK